MPDSTTTIITNAAYEIEHDLGIINRTTGNDNILGTSRDRLIRQMTDASESCRDLLTILNTISEHKRDYHNGEYTIIEDAILRIEHETIIEDAVLRIFRRHIDPLRTH